MKLTFQLLFCTSLICLASCQKESTNSSSPMEEANFTGEYYGDLRFFGYGPYYQDSTGRYYRNEWDDTLKGKVFTVIEDANFPDLLKITYKDAQDSLIVYMNNFDPDDFGSYKDTVGGSISFWSIYNVSLKNDSLKVNIHRTNGRGGGILDSQLRAIKVK